MKTFLSAVFFLMVMALALWHPRIAHATGELGILFEDEQEFNSRLNQQSSQLKSHTIGSTDGAILFFNLFCEGNASGIGGTEALVSRVDTVTTPTGGEALITMVVCEFCECAGLEGQAFEDCHTAKESCATFENSRFVFDVLQGLPPDPDFPDASRIMFTMTQQDNATNCTGKFKEFCDADNLKLIHHCTHLFDASGNIVKSVNSAFVFKQKN